MEPRPHERGKWRRMNATVSRWVASMEPRPHERGKPAVALALQAAGGASMEPRPHERGKPIFRKPDVAACVLQWSHVLTNVERIRAETAICAGQRLQWSHVLTNVERFSQGLGTRWRVDASMEPRPHERGKTGAS